jgi:hypothetical protein
MTSRLVGAIVLTLFVKLPAGKASTIVVRGDVVSLPLSSITRTVSLDVFADLSNATSQQISAHQLRVTLPDETSNLTMLAAGAPTRHRYAGPSVGPVVAVSDTRVDSGDIALVGAATLTSGAGLLRVDVAIPANMPAGLYRLVISPDPLFTFVVDAAGVPLMTQVISGGIRVSTQEGDYDFDRDVDDADYLVWRRDFGSVGLFAADGTSDGVVDAADYVVWRNSRTVATTFGDFNGDGAVDAADYVVWRDGLGTTYTQNEYNVWRAHFGETVSSRSGSSQQTARDNLPAPIAALPEPATFPMVILAAIALYFGLIVR